MCCAAGNGSYSIEVMKKNGQYRQAASGGSFGSNMSHVIDVGHTESKMTDRDEQYLVAHNKRRREWHARYGKEFRPLVWSNGLKESAMIYATKLLDDCTSGPPGKVDSDTFQMGSFSFIRTYLMFELFQFTIPTMIMPKTLLETLEAEVGGSCTPQTRFSVDSLNGRKVGKRLSDVCFLTAIVSENFLVRSSLGKEW